MRHPGIAAIGVVLDDHEPATGSELRGQRADDRHLPVGRQEMEAVRGDEPVEHAERRAARPLAKSAISVVRRVPGKRDATAAAFVASARPSRSTATIRPPGPSRSASASVNAPSPAPMSAHVPPGSTAGRSRAT